ncbi:MAG: hypothetical protein JJLCMIEE_03333 [Acidimicrobiales bacterium]|nr:MAG: DUF1800 domain-containing protein [Actinomycetota bacterium]MBV6510203.1 hypothetical protein [Acidimicrobiales bacterium]RIK03529.1 MAG: DUF1800 domain-containing protein [Acidobacteriota bacterium]
MDRRAFLIGAGAAAVAASCGPPDPGGGSTTSSTSTSSTTTSSTSTSSTTTSSTTTSSTTTSSTTSTTIPGGGGLPPGDVLHVVKRLTSGPTPELVEHVESIGVQAFIAEQLDPFSLDDAETEALIAGFATLTMDPAELRATYGEARRYIVAELTTAAVLRATYSVRQLYEVMVDFWTNHFNIYLRDQPEFYLKPTDDRLVIRPNAMGRFADLLLASAQSPAMLTYLDNATSRADGEHVPNENYAREVMELHTVGVDGGYDEQDVAEAAHVLSGWSVDRRSGQFVFRPDRHDLGESLSAGGDILGWRPSGEGMGDGIAFLEHLARLPQTAERICWKLAVRFIGDQVGPGDDVVQSTASVYSDNDTAIVPVLEHLFDSEEFWDSMGAKVRRPADLVPAMMRALQVQVDPTQGEGLARDVTTGMELLGQPLFSWSPPTGFPDVGGAWMNAGAVLTRWNAAQMISSGSVGAITPDFSAVIGDEPMETVGDLVDRFAHRLLFEEIDPGDRQAILDGLGKGAADPLRPEDELLYPQLAAFVLESHPAQVR